MKLEDVTLYDSNGNNVLGYLVATFVSDTFSATGYVLGVTWSGYADTDSFEEISTDYNLVEACKEALQENTPYFEVQLGAILCIKTTTTVSIQGHLFTNVSPPTIEFIGELTTKQKNLLWEASGFKMSLEDFESKFHDSLCENFNLEGSSYNEDISWNNFIETEYETNYSAYVL